MAEALALVRSVCAEAGATPPWHRLQFLCPDAVAGAAEILDHKVVTRVVARSSRRAFHLVEGQSRGRDYTCLPGFCTCMSYCLHVASRPEAVVCKHELATLLADSLGLVRRRAAAAPARQHARRARPRLAAPRRRARPRPTTRTGRSASTTRWPRR